MPDSAAPQITCERHPIRPPADLCGQAMSGLAFADRAHPGDVVGIDLRFCRDMPAAPFQVTSGASYWVMGTSGPEMHRLHEVATHKLGRASFALAGLLDAEDHLENLKAEARLDPVFSASLHVTLIALRDAAFLIDSHALAAWSVGVVDVAEMPKRCLVTANLSEVGDRLAHRGAARFFEAMTRRTEIQEVAYSS